MKENEINKIIYEFEKNIDGYLALVDRQAIITESTYLFLNAKYTGKLEFNSDMTISDLEVYLQESAKDEKEYLKEIYTNIKNSINTNSLINIFKYLNTLTKEELVKIICSDYEAHSRYTEATADTISQLAYKILENTKGTKVIDLCSYTGSFLTNYAQKQNKYTYTAIEINHKSNLIAKAKLNAMGVINNVITDNVLGFKFKETYDKVFCNYPFLSKMDTVDLNKINNIKNKLKFEFNSKISSSWAFVNSVINALDEKGKAIVLMNNAVLFKMQDMEYRKALIEAGLIEAVISLPGNIFANTAIATTLLILNYNNNKVKFIDATEMYIKGIPRNELKCEEIYNEYISEKETSHTKLVQASNIEKNNYSLYVENYMDIEKIEIKYPRKLKEVSKEINRGYQVSSAEVSQLSENKNNTEPYRIINIVNVNDGEIDQDLTRIYPDNNKMDKYLLEDNDLIISSKGTINKVAIVKVKNNEKYLPSGNFTIIRLNTEIINPYYLKIFLESDKGLAIIGSIKSGGVLPAINVSQLKEIEIPVPDMKTQEALIEKYLSKKEEIKIVKNKLKTLEENLQNITNDEF